MIENLKKIIDKYKDSVDFIEAINIKSNNTPISVKANEINSIESNFSDGIGIRVIKDGKTGFSFSNSIEKIDSVVKSALSSSVFGDKIDFSYPEESKLLQMHDKLDIFSSETADVSVDIMRSELEGLITDISEIDTLNIDADVSKTVSDVSIINSLDRSGSYKKSSYSLSAYGVKVDENGLLWVGSYSSAINRNNIKKDYILSEFRNQLDKSDVFVNPNSSQKMAVVFSPSAYGFLLETFSMGVNGKNHYKKTSPLYNRIGEKVLANNITLFEDPLSNELMGSALFDRELIPTRKKYLFENGIYKSVITDIKITGKHIGLSSAENRIYK